MQGLSSRLETLNGECAACIVMMPAQAADPLAVNLVHLHGTYKKRPSSTEH